MTTPDRPGGIPDETWRAYLMVKARIDERHDRPPYGAYWDDAACQADNPASAKMYEENVNTFLDEFVSPHQRSQQHDLVSRAIREAAMSYQDSSTIGPTWVNLTPEEQLRQHKLMRWAIKRYHEIMGSELG